MKKSKKLTDRPSAVLFDFDGVIVQSTELKSNAFVEVYKNEPAEAREKIRAYQEQNGGIGRREKFAHFEKVIFGRPATDERIDALCDSFARLVDERLVDVAFVDGALETLQRLAGRSEQHLISGMPEIELKSVLVRRKLDGYFQSVHGSPTEKLVAFRQIVENTRFPPSACLAVGDSLTEYEAAVQLGIPFLAIVASTLPSPFPADVASRPNLSGLVEYLGF